MSTIAVSSFSLHSKLGPLRMRIRDEQGQRQLFEYGAPAELTLEQFAQRVRSDLDVAAIELCQIQLEDDADAIRSLRSSLDDAGVSVLTVPIDIGSLSTATGEHLEEDIEDIVRWFDHATTLGATFVRVNAGLPLEQAAAENRSTLVAALGRLGDAATERGLRLLVENHGGQSSVPEFLIGLIEEVGKDRLGILLDLGNFPPVQDVSSSRMRGQAIDPMSVDPEVVYEKIEQLAPHATLVHAKAYDPRPDGSPLLDIERALKIVAGAGYEGNISVEWEGAKDDPWDGTTATTAAVRRAFPNLDA